jgi:hypothetical protein
MSGAADPYIRLYFRVRNDPRFEHVYGCDPCWAAYTRLLFDAEAAFPVPASLPSTLRPHAKAELLAAGIIELRIHGCYVIHGLEAERERRSHQGRAGASARWDASAVRTDSERNANASPKQAGADANALRQHPASGSDALLAESTTESESTTEQEQGASRARAHEDDADPAYNLRVWLAAHNAPVRDGDGYHTRLVRYVATGTGKTTADVIAAFERLQRDGAKTAKQYVMGAEDLLFPTIKTGNGKAPSIDVHKYDHMVESGDEPRDGAAKPESPALDDPQSYIGGGS